MIKEMKSTKILRMGIYLKSKNIPILPRLIQKYLRLFYNFEVIISRDLSIGRNVRFAHNGLGVTINQKTKIGNNVKIYQNVTIGSNRKIVNGEIVNEGSPIILDNVTIFSGAVIVGQIILGSGSVIGANAVVTKDIPPNSIVYPSQHQISTLKKDIRY